MFEGKLISPVGSYAAENTRTASFRRIVGMMQRFAEAHPWALEKGLVMPDKPSSPKPENRKASQRANRNRQARLARAVAYARNHPEVSVTAICRRFRVNPSHLAKVLTKRGRGCGNAEAEASPDEL